MTFHIDIYRTANVMIGKHEEHAMRLWVRIVQCVRVKKNAEQSLPN